MVGDIAHVFNRGVDKRKIILDKNDYFRFTNDLFLINNKSGKIRTRRKENLNPLEFNQEKLVEVLKWTILPNHFHLLLYEVIEGGISEYIRRLGNAYTKYFNTKNKGRSGYLFQNKAQIVPIQEDSQFLYIPFYIDLNVLDLKFKDWKSNRPGKVEAKSFLRTYDWSSYKDYFGEGRRDFIINKELFYSLFNTELKKYENELLDFMHEADVSTWHVDTRAIAP